MSARTGICYNMAHSGKGGTPANRFVSGWGLGTHGDYTNLSPDPFAIARRENEAGRPAPDLWWWQPQGTDGDGYLINTISRCIQTGNWRLLESWQRLVIDYLDEFPEAESIAHIGRDGQNNVSLDYRERVTFESFYLIAHERMGVCFDSLGGDYSDDKASSMLFADDLRASGHRIFAEPFAKPDNDRLNNVPAMASAPYVFNQISDHPAASHSGDLIGFLEWARERHGTVWVRGIRDRFNRFPMTMEELAEACMKVGVGFAWPANHERWNAAEAAKGGGA